MAGAYRVYEHMLQNIREKFMGRIAVAILGLIALTFVFVGGANFAFIGSNYAATVDDVEIGLGQFESAYREQLQQNPSFAQLSDDLRMQLRRNILEQLIQQRVVDNYLIEAGFQIDDALVTEMIQRTPDFQVDGKFDLDTYRNLLALNGYEPSQFERAQRQTLRRNQLERAIRGSAVLTPAAFRRFLNLAGEQRLVRMATLDPEAVNDELEITEEMIQAFYDNNPTMFQLPETVDVAYVEIRRSDVAQTVNVTEEEILEYYEFNADRYQQDEQRQARHILILFGDDETAAEEEATALRARVDAGEPFEDLARQYSDDTLTAGQGGDLGVLTESQLPPDIAGAVFTMEEGAIEGPIRSDFGFHVVRLEEIIEPGPMPLEQVRAALTIELQDQKAESLFRDLERGLSDALFDAGDIETLAAAVGAEVQTVAGFTREGGEPLGSEPAIIDAVFDGLLLEGEQLSEIIEIDASRSAVFSVSNYQAATRQPLGEVREEVIENVRFEEGARLMAARAEEMIAALADGIEFGAAAEAVGATAGEPVLMGRGDPDADQFLQVAVFAAEKPTQDQPVVGSTPNGVGAHTVYSIEAVLPGRPEGLPVEQRDAGKEQLTEQAGIGDFVAFVQALRENAEVVINEDAVTGSDLL
jgi:peptidyl-prolyl cis-trans isomerase D